MKRVEFAFGLRDRVTIEELRAKGRVIGLYYGEHGPEYRVRYFYDGTAKIEYFFEDEICEVGQERYRST